MIRVLSIIFLSVILFQKSVLAESPFGSLNPNNPFSEVSSPFGSLNPNNPFSEVSSPTGSLNPNNPFSEVSSPTGKFNPNNPFSEGDLSILGIPGLGN